MYPRLFDGVIVVFTYVILLIVGRSMQRIAVNNTLY